MVVTFPRIEPPITGRGYHGLDVICTNLAFIHIKPRCKWTAAFSSSGGGIALKDHQSVSSRDHARIHN